MVGVLTLTVKSNRKWFFLSEIFNNRYIDSQGFFSDTLKKVKMPIVARGECEAKLRAHERFRGKNFRLHQSWLCVGGEKDSDTCKGDGGSPHVCINKDNRYVQVESAINSPSSLLTDDPPVRRLAPLPGELAAAMRSPLCTARQPGVCAG